MALTQAKAKKVLREKRPTLRGKSITPRQRRFLGFLAGGGTPTRVKGLGEAIENLHGRTPLPKDKFSHNLKSPSNVKPRNKAIVSPKYKSETPASKGVNLF